MIARRSPYRSSSRGVRTVH